MINPLLFCPSPRNIPEVIKSWEDIPYDKYIVKGKLELPAYQDGRNYFLAHPEYTHLVICPDDLVIYHYAFMLLLRDMEEYEFSNLAGISNIDESQPNVFCCKPLGIDIRQNTGGSFYTEETIPTEIFEAGFTGFSCQWIDRYTMEKLSFTGGCQNGAGCMDFKFTEELTSMKQKQIVEPKAFFYHMRMAQYHEVIAWKNRAHLEGEGYSILLKAGDIFTPKIVLCVMFYNDLDNIKRLMNTVKGQLVIFVDGKWINKDGPELSNDGSREFILSCNNTILIDAPNLIEHQARNKYIVKAQELDIPYCLVIDSDEYIVEFDYEAIIESLKSNEPTYSHRQYYDSTFHSPYYRIHKSIARHNGRHQDIYINDIQVFTPKSTILDGFVTRHDKDLRSKEREDDNHQYYKDNPVR